MARYSEHYTSNLSKIWNNNKDYVFENVDSIFSLENLLEGGADPDAADQFGCTGLHLACKYNRADIWGLFVKYGGDPSRLDKFENTTLHLAAANVSDFNFFSTVLRNFTGFVNEANVYGSTPLHEVCSNDTKSELFCEALLQFGANPNMKRKGDGTTPLHIAIEVGSYTLVYMMLDGRADPDLRNNYGVSPLFLAISKPNETMCRYLLQFHADVSLDSEPAGIIEREFTGEYEKGKKSLLQMGLFSSCKEVSNAFYYWITHSESGKMYDTEANKKLFLAMQKPLYDIDEDKDKESDSYSYEEEDSETDSSSDSS